MSAKPDVSHEVGTRLLFENDRVRVWDLRLAPGERTGFHRHETDYLYVVIGDGTLRAVREDGSEMYTQAMADGEVRFREVAGSDVHDAENVGESEWRNIVVELKQG